VAQERDICHLVQFFHDGTESIRSEKTHEGSIR